MFCTVQPFWELIEFLYSHQHELGPTDVRLHLFKQGVPPDVAHPQVARGSRLRVVLSDLFRGDSSDRSVVDAAVSMLMLVACAQCEHEEHILGIELSFSGLGSSARVSCAIWFSEALAIVEDSVSDLVEEVAEALNIGGDENYTDVIRVEPFPPLPRSSSTAAAGEEGSKAGAEGPQPFSSQLTRRVLPEHPNPLLHKLQSAIQKAAQSPEVSQSTTPPSLNRGMLNPQRRRHTAIVLDGLKAELLRDRKLRNRGNARRRNTTATATRGGPTPGAVGSSTDHDERRGRKGGSLMRRRSASLGDTTIEAGPEALCVPDIST